MSRTTKDLVGLFCIGATPCICSRLNMEFMKCETEGLSNQQVVPAKAREVKVDTSAISAFALTLGGGGNFSIWGSNISLKVDHHLPVKLDAIPRNLSQLCRVAKYFAYLLYGHTRGFACKR